MSLTNYRDSQISEKPHWLLVSVWCALLVALVPYIFWGVWRFYFACDDFTYFAAVKEHNVFRISSQSLHYQPIGQIIAAFPGILVGPNPLLDNIFLILFCLFATLLTIYVAHLVTRDLVTSLAAGLLFLTFADNHEIMFWKTGRITSAMVILCVASFIFFAKYLKSKDFRQLVLCNILLLIALLTTEQACFIVPVWACYELLFHFSLQKAKSPLKNFAELAASTRKYIPALALVISVFAFKFYHGQRLQPVWLHVKPLIVQGAIHGIFDYNHVLSSSGILPLVRAWAKAFPISTLTAIVGFLIVLIVVCRRKWSSAPGIRSACRNAAFFLLWGCITYLPLFAIMGPQYRYFALASVGMACFAAILSRSIGIYVGNRFGRFRNLATELITLVLVLSLSIPGLRLLTAAKRNWRKASEVEHNLVDSYQFYTKNLDKRTRVYLVNVPDRLLPEVHSFFIARNGFITEVSYYDERSIVLVSIGATVRSRYPVLQSARSMDFCSALDLTRKPESLVLVFDPAAERLKQWQALSSQDANEFVASDSGFYPWEYEASEQVRWRWTEGNAFLVLNIGCYPGARQIDGISIELGGSPHLLLHPVISVENEELARLEVDHSGLRRYRIIFPEEVKEKIKDRKLIELRIRSEAWRPSDYGLSPDYRLLGVAVGDLEFIEQADDKVGNADFL